MINPNLHIFDIDGVILDMIGNYCGTIHHDEVDSGFVRYLRTAHPHIEMVPENRDMSIFDMARYLGFVTPEGGLRPLFTGFYNSEFYGSLKPYPGAVERLREIHSNPESVIIFCSSLSGAYEHDRAQARINNIHAILNQSGAPIQIPHEQFYLIDPFQDGVKEAAYKTVAKNHGFGIVYEDSPKNAENARLAGHQVILFEHAYNESVEVHQDIRRISAGETSCEWWSQMKEPRTLRDSVVRHQISQTPIAKDLIK
jgi:hypothetical protein